MTMKKEMTILTVLAVLIICSCNTKKQEYRNTPASVEYEAIAISSQTNGQISTERFEPEDRKIIKHAEIEFETEDVNKTKSLIVQTVQELDGYISSDDTFVDADQLLHILRISVPADKFDFLLVKISETVGKLDKKSVEVSDVTAEYIDIDSRIRTKKALQNRYVELLKQATKVDEILNIEKEIGKLQEEIESVEGRMKYLKNKIAYSTLTVGYYQKTTSTFGFFSKFTEGIKKGWSVFLWFIIGLSHLWVFIFIATVAIYLIIRQRRKEKKNV